MFDFPAIVKVVRQKGMCVCCGVLQSVAVRCGVLQCAADCGLMQYV